jgi:hypothetical protein
LVQAKIEEGTLEADLPPSQRPPALPVLTLDMPVAPSADCDQGAVSSSASVVDNRALTAAMLPSVRVVCGGVKLPDDAMDGNAL